jgi:hypothetical protein
MVPHVPLPRCRHHGPDAQLKDRIDSVGGFWSTEPTSLEELDDAIAELSDRVGLLHTQRDGVAGEV